ncbi:hypothetical protein AX15_001915 [Amanita polypyramis BW_CC]|nr:hypothetical protein AX15_001915 [Amanita polypyramis BW_CC]
MKSTAVVLFALAATSVFAQPIEGVVLEARHHHKSQPNNKANDASHNVALHNVVPHPVQHKHHLNVGSVFGKIGKTLLKIFLRRQVPSDLEARAVYDGLGHLEARNLDNELEARNFDDGLEARDFDDLDELEARDFYDDLEARDFDDLDELEARDFYDGLDELD